jgi:TM2 domain-containing membrane protein YozV
MNAVCPYCRTEIDTDDGGRMECSSCGTPHHRDCFTENGGCTVFGCAQAPPDEPKISLTGHELVSSPLAMAESLGLSGPGATIAPPPPPPVLNTRDTTSVPPPPPLPGYGNSPLPPGAATYNSVGLTAAELYAGVDARKNRVVYVLLGLFLGFLGAHSFYAGYYRRGAAQASVSMFSWWLFSQGYGSLISWIWAVVEICMITKDADGVQFS